MINPELSIVTVTMNHLPILKKMLHSLYVTAKPKASFELIIVDNCSTDRTGAYIKENYPDIHLIINEKIEGFSTNNNKGAKQARGKYILILNPDIILLQDSIDILLDYLKHNSFTGIAAPKLLNPDMSIQYSARRFMSLRLFFLRLLTKGNDENNNKTIQNYLLTNISLTEPSFVDWCMGAALMFPLDFYRQLKGFDEEFFLYVEDTDICYRCWEKGKHVVYIPMSQMIHEHQRSSTKGINKKTFYHLKSYFRFFKKNNFRIKTVN